MKHLPSSPMREDCYPVTRVWRIVFFLGIFCIALWLIIPSLNIYHTVMQVMTPSPWIGPLTTNIIAYTAYEINMLIL